CVERRSTGGNRHHYWLVDTDQRPALLASLAAGGVCVLPGNPSLRTVFLFVHLRRASSRNLPDLWGSSSAASAESKLKSCKSLIGVNTLSSGFDITQGGFEGGDDVDHGAIQKRRGRIVAPLRMRSVQDYVIPIESTPYKAGGLYFWWLGGGSAIQVL